MLQALVIVIRANDHGNTTMFPQRSCDWASWLPQAAVWGPGVVELASSLVCDFLHLSHIGSFKSFPEAY